MTRAAPGPLRQRLDPSARFFFYGTLLDPDVQRLVMGQALPPARAAPATLPGYRRVRAAGKWFPILVPGTARDTADGIAVEGLARAEIDRLIAYEGPAYRLTQATVRTRAGAARAWVFLPRRSLRPTTEPWRLAQWQRDFKPRVLRLIP